MPTLRSRGGLFLVWMVFAAFIGVGFWRLGCGKELSQANQLATKGRQVRGRIATTLAGNPLNNPAAQYDFSAENYLFDSWSHITTQTSRELKQGSLVTVTYLPSDPEGTNAIDLEGLRQSGRKGVLIACVVELILALIFIPMILAGGPGPRLRSALTGRNTGTMAVLTAVFFMGLGILIFRAIPAYNRAIDLVETGHSAPAQIFGLLIDTDRSSKYIGYTFEAEGGSYNGKAPYNDGYRDREILTITYLPSDPSYSAISPANEVANAKVGVIFMVIWCGLTFIIGSIVVIASFSGAIGFRNQNLS